MLSPVTITDAELAALVARMDEAAAAHINGETRRCHSLFGHPDGT